MSISSSLNAGVAGLSSNSVRLATISDNIANASTYGYRRADTAFYSMVVGDGNSAYSAGGVRAESGRLIDVGTALTGTGNATDLAVQGRGLFPVTTGAALTAGDPGGDFRLATTGSFRPDAQGYLRNGADMVLMGWPAGADGTVPSLPRDTAAGLVPVRIDTTPSPAEPTSLVEIAANLPATATEAGAPGAMESLTATYYDQFGNARSLTFDFAPTVPAAGAGGASNEWTLTVTDGATGNLVGEYTLGFSNGLATGGLLDSVTAVAGGPYDPATGRVVVNLGMGPAEISIGRIGEPDGLVQRSDAYAPISVDSNGNPVGNVTSVDVDENGFLRANYDTGSQRVLYQIPLADVANPDGLETLDAQTYRVSRDSGEMLLWDAGDGPTGQLRGFSLEESTVDVARELTDLIRTQRAYSSNAKVIQTVDEMLQETTNIKR